MTAFPFAGCSEPFSSLTHLVAAIVCLPCSWSMLKLEPKNKTHRLSLKIFCFACFFLLLMSGVYHLLPLESQGRAVLQRLDHAAIFILIAGTFTPIHSILFRGFWRWGPLAVIWSIAVAGITLKSIYFRQIPEDWGISVYLVMGWLGALTGGLVWLKQGFEFVQPLINGALLYSSGTIFEFFNQPILLRGVIGPHELFHLAVLGGIYCHWCFIRKVALTQVLIPVSSSSESEIKRLTSSISAD